jgi:hypothetical protein
LRSNQAVDDCKHQANMARTKLRCATAGRPWEPPMCHLPRCTPPATSLPQPLPASMPAR